jgi:hypothetical protein
MQKYLWLVLVLPFFQCTNATLQQEIASTKAQLAEVQAALDRSRQELENDQTNSLGQLIHLVFFNVKPTASLDSLITEIKTLKAIEVVKDLEVGPFQDLGDTRALSDYALLMQLTFDSAADYKIYQGHPIHLALQANTKSLMAGPPATYDFVAK